MKKSFLLLAAILVIGIIIILVLIDNNRQKIVVSPARLTVAATIFPLYDILRNVAGDGVRVLLIIPPGASEENFDPTPETAKNIQQTKIIFKVGLLLDDWVDILNADAKIVAAWENIEIKEFDPHYWLDAANAIKIAETMARELAVLDPLNAKTYQTNFNNYQAELLKLNDETRNKLSALERRDLITFHDAWQYFADAYDLNVITVVQPSPGQEPTPKYLESLISLAKEYQVKTIFSEPQLSSAALEPLIKDLGLKMLPLDAIGGTAGRESYFNLMRYNTQTIIEGVR